MYLQTIEKVIIQNKDLIEVADLEAKDLNLVKALNKIADLEVENLKDFNLVKALNKIADLEVENL